MEPASRFCFPTEKCSAGNGNVGIIFATISRTGLENWKTRVRNFMLSEWTEVIMDILSSSKRRKTQTRTYGVTTQIHQRSAGPLLKQNPKYSNITE
jgi:hypothetical protein